MARKILFFISGVCILFIACGNAFAAQSSFDTLRDQIIFTQAQADEVNSLIKAAGFNAAEFRQFNTLSKHNLERARGIFDAFQEIVQDKGLTDAKINERIGGLERE